MTGMRSSARCSSSASDRGWARRWRTDIARDGADLNLLAARAAQASIRRRQEADHIDAGDGH